jgi:hypothetical protein
MRPHFAKVVVMTFFGFAVGAIGQILHLSILFIIKFNYLCRSDKMARFLSFNP